MFDPRVKVPKVGFSALQAVGRTRLAEQPLSQANSELTGFCFVLFKSPTRRSSRGNQAACLKKQPESKEKVAREQTCCSREPVLCPP